MSEKMETSIEIKVSDALIDGAIQEIPDMILKGESTRNIKELPIYQVIISKEKIEDYFHDITDQVNIAKGYNFYIQEI
jgi:hypothetical protein